MGRKEQQKKSKRNLATQTPVAKQPASAGRPARAPPPNGAAGSGTPASSVSSGGVEAEWKLVEPEDKVVIPTSEGGARQEWDYDEGKDGKYTCAQCGKKLLRSHFLIEAADGDGKLRCEYDKEGRLYGRCYDCCRGRGGYAGPEDTYADVSKHTKRSNSRGASETSATRGTTSAATSRKTRMRS